MIKAIATAYILPALFDEYEYDQDQAGDEISFEIGLDTFLEAINIFGSGGGNVAPISEKTARRGWRDRDRDGENERNEDRDRDEDDGPNAARTRPGSVSWGKGGAKACTTMTMTFEGPGCPLKLFL